MPNDDFTPHLSELDGDYQVLTELHRTANSRSFLARHLKLNRDVTITVVRAAGDRNSLKRFAADVERLKTARHANVIPVIEGRWLGNDAFAVVRARVRGSTLDQLVSAVGPIPLPRIAGTLGEVRSALDWARATGIANRTVAPDALIFQQGSGRVLLALDPAPSAPPVAPDVCDDTRTLGRLAWEMLAGRQYTNATASSLPVLRPDLSPAIVGETEAMVRCTRGAPRDVTAYLEMLAAAVGVGGTTGVADVPAPSRMVIADPTPLYTAPAGPLNAAAGAAVTPKRSWGFNARLATAVAVIAVIVVMAFMFMHGRTRTVVDRTAVNARSQAVAGEAAGDVALHAQHPDTSMFTPMPATPAPQIEYPASPMVPPPTRRHEPLRTPPRLTYPAPAVPGTPDNAIPAAAPQADNATSNDVCSTPTSTDQHRCLMNAIDRNDVVLDAVYHQLIAALRRQANVTSTDPDPDSVTRLRNAQRRWLDERDQVCRIVGAGPLYARDRAQCFADQSAERSRELQRQLDGIPAGT